MSTLIFRACALLTAATLASCASGGDLPPPPPNFHTAHSIPVVQSDYVIGPQDRIAVEVFQTPDLTLESVQVDAAGEISMPLIGTVRAAGKSSKQLSADIAARLQAGYLQSPQVTVRIVEAVSHRVTVEGAVNQPGVYSLTGPTTLLQAIAMARGPTDLADVRRVAIFRNIDNRRAAAVFDLAAIRKGEATDPEVQGSDIIVVQDSQTKGLLQDLMRAVPVIGIFRYF